MSVGDSGKYRILEIHGRHFSESAKRAGLGKAAFARILDELSADAAQAFAKVEANLPQDFPAALPTSVASAFRRQLDRLATARQGED